MGLFSFKSKVDFYAPVSGKLVDLKDVSDEVFASGAMGKGFAIIPDGGNIYSPVKGKVSQLFPTKHAVGLQCGKMEVLIHIGIDTVDLKGEPFTTMVSVGDKVDNNSVLVKTDFEKIKKADKDPVTMVLITNTNNVLKSFDLVANNGDKVDHATEIAEVKEK
ncbi:PTS glucose transporter subunit IIA [Companilactobacillus crustorum]|uniref:PTS sugar transporter subunit IIA n=1 Tax=Companilactobacillus crustorum TaxID=392416 RepID=UPI00237D88D8|nr:PTS glucose transporter subunit IIA [Companilactobacillus crustorum]WDT66428.1 PTS glucose transporter subunit IIA [Companilactobacillus crustorum]